MRRFALYLIVHMVTSIGAASASAETADLELSARDSLRVYWMDEDVVVSAAKLPMSLYDLAGAASIVSEVTIDRSTARTLPELLSASGGLHAFGFAGNGMATTVESRGFTGFGETSHLRFLVDGVPFSDLSDDNAVWNLFDLDQLERVEIVRSASASLHGNTSYTGVVNLIPRTAVGPKWTWGKLEGGSFDHRAATGGVSWSERAWSGAVSGNWRRTGGFRTHSEWEGGSGFASVALRRDPETHARVSVHYHDADAEMPGALPENVSDETPTLASTPLDHDDVRRLYALTDFGTSFGEAHEVRVSLHVQREDRRRRQTILDTQELDRDATISGFQASYRATTTVAGVPVRLLTGLEGSAGTMTSTYNRVMEDGDLAEELSRGNVGRDEIAGYLRLSAEVVPRLTFTAGIRRDDLRTELVIPNVLLSGEPHDKAMGAWSPTASLNYRWKESRNAYLSVS